MRERSTCCHCSVGTAGWGSGMMYNSLEFMQTIDSAPKLPLSGGIPQALGNNRDPRRGKLHFLNWTSSKSHCDLQYHKRPFWHRWSMLLPQTVMKPGMHMDICNFCCWSKPRWCLQASLSQGAMLMWVACATTWDHVEAWDRCSHSLISESGIFVLPEPC